MTQEQKAAILASYGLGPDWEQVDLLFALMARVDEIVERQKSPPQKK